MPTFEVYKATQSFSKCECWLQYTISTRTRFADDADYNLQFSKTEDVDFDSYKIQLPKDSKIQYYKLAQYQIISNKIQVKVSYSNPPLTLQHRTRKQIRRGRSSNQRPKNNRALACITQLLEMIHGWLPPASFPFWSLFPPPFLPGTLSS